MSVRLVWQIFLKDARRFWWLILLTLLLLGRLTHFDSWRDTAMPNSEEGWLNILLPLAWSVLIALAVFEDSTAAESPFWVTLPCRWRPFLVAKTLFVLVFIHLPYFIACAMILQARGLHVSIPALLLRQLVLLSLTLPAIALATLVRNVTQYMMVAIVIATVAGALPMGGEFLTNGGVTKEIREGILLPIAVLAALWIAFAQYRSRRTASSRIVGAVASLISLTIWMLPQEHFDGLEAALFRPPATLAPPVIQLADAEVRHGFVGARTGVGIPISTSAPPPGYSQWFRQSSLRIREAEGRTENAKMPTQMSAGSMFAGGDALMAGFGGLGSQTPMQQIAATPETLKRLSDGPIAIQGSALFLFFRDMTPVWTSVNRSVALPGFGKCTTALVGDAPDDDNLKVSCESLHSLPPVHVTLKNSVDGREWHHDLDSSRSIPDYPTGTWLSPVNRGETRFPLTDEEHYAAPGGKWEAPREVIPTAKIGIAPSIPQGSSLIQYQLPEVRLKR